MAVESEEWLLSRSPLLLLMFGVLGVNTTCALDQLKEDRYAFLMISAQTKKFKVACKLERLLGV